MICIRCDVPPSIYRHIIRAPIVVTSSVAVGDIVRRQRCAVVALIARSRSPPSGPGSIDRSKSITLYAYLTLCVTMFAIEGNRRE